MRRAAALLTGLALAGSVRADHGIEIAARAGAGVPFGNVEGGSSTTLGDLYSAEFPLVLDLGYRFSDRWSAGAFFQYGVAVVNACGIAESSLPATCSGTVLRVGLEAAYRFTPGAAWTPWVGLGTGFEWARATLSAPGVASGGTLKGVEIGNVQAGGDWRVSSSLAIGPYAAASVGTYLWSSTDGRPGSEQISLKAVHGWVQLGVKATFEVPLGGGGASAPAAAARGVAAALNDAANHGSPREEVAK